MTTKLLIDRELLERIRELLCIIGHRQDDYGVEAEFISSLLKKVLAQPAQQSEAVEVRGLQWLDTGHYRKKPPQFGYNPHDWNELCRLSDAKRAIAELREECDTLRQQLAEREAEILEQCRLNGMGAERELKLIAQRDKLAGLLVQAQGMVNGATDEWHDAARAALAEVDK